MSHNFHTNFMVKSKLWYQAIQNSHDYISKCLKLWNIYKNCQLFKQ